MYENTYGTDNDRVIVMNKPREEDMEESSGNVYDGLFKRGSATTTPVDLSLDLIDFPTYNFAELNIMGREVAAAALDNRKNLGQMILFYDKTSRRIVDSLHDKYNVISHDDINCRDYYGQMMRSHNHVGSESRGLLTTFFNKIKSMDRRTLTIRRVVINIPTNQEEVDRLMDPPVADLMMTHTQNSA